MGNRKMIITDATSTENALVGDLERMKLQLNVIEARIRDIAPEHANLLADLADDAKAMIEKLETGF